MEQREMNFFELCVACAKAIGRGCKALWSVFCQMLRHTFQYWWIVFPCLILAVGAGYYYSRYENLNYRVNAVAMLNGPTITQFQQAFSPLCSGQNIPAGEKIGEYIYSGKVAGFASYRVIDCLHDGVADYIDFDEMLAEAQAKVVEVQAQLAEAQAKAEEAQAKATEAQAKAEEAQAKSGKAQLKAKAEGRTEGKIEVAKRMLNDNLSVELISKFTGLSQDEVDKLR